MINDMKIYKLRDIKILRIKNIKQIIFLFLIYIWYITAIKGACHSCLWIRYKFPHKNHCIYYQKDCNIISKNCTNYAVSQRLLAKNL
jgi:hypothetical protein